MHACLTSGEEIISSVVSSMAKLMSSHHHLLLLFLCVVLVFESDATAAVGVAGEDENSSLTKPLRRPPALFVVGDSTVDTGNNNFIQTVIKCNFSPYGRDFRNHKATGRFSNGRLSIDFIASYMGIKEFMPPYLDRSLSLKELMSGVIFASAASGFDPLTAKLSRVIPMPKQLQQFKEYKRRIANEVGREKMEQLIKDSVFLISAGTNDFAVNYFPFPFRKNFTVPEYQLFVL